MALSVSKSISKSVCALLLLFAATIPSMGQQSEAPESIGTQIKNLGWKTGPSEGKVAGRATIAIPAKYRFLGAADTSKFLTLQGNLPSTDNYTFAPDDLNWFAILDVENRAERLVTLGHRPQAELERRSIQFAVQAQAKPQIVDWRRPSKLL